MPDPLPTEKQFSLIRLLIALAWADGEINTHELNFLKDFFFKLDLSGEDWAKIEVYLEDPIPPEEAEVLIQDFVKLMGGSKEREAVIASMEKMISADGRNSPEEEAFLKQCTEMFRNSGPASSLIGGLRGLFRNTLMKPAAVSKRAEEIDDFLNNRILFKVRRKLERDKLSLEADPEALAYASLFAGLLGFVAAAQDGVSEVELQVLKKSLKDMAGFDEEGLAIITSVVEDAAAKGLDAFSMARRFYNHSSKAQREQLLDCMFDVAGADDDLSHVEHEATRTISDSLKFSNREFIAAKLRYRERANGG